jgi:geranylgeranyl diphosphate synthase type II
MHSFKELSEKINTHFHTRHFPETPANLYEAAEYILQIGGKRIRPVMCLMGNELFAEISSDAYHVAAAIELFHNFSLIHDDIMDKAPLRRGVETVHIKYGESTALLAGDVMLVRSYDYLSKIKADHLPKVLQLFNKVGREVCEGQQLDMDFEQKETVQLQEYVHMITLKTSVLLAASLQFGAILGGAAGDSQQHLYEFGKNLGIAFQIQDDYLDAFGDPEKFGKQVGGDIMANKKTFLMIYALETASPQQRIELKRLMKENPSDKVAKVLQIFKDCKVGEWANQLKEKYLQTALQHLEDTAVQAVRKKPLIELAGYLIQREK